MKSYRILAVSALLLISLLAACGATTPQETSGSESQGEAPEPGNGAPSGPEIEPSPVPSQVSVSGQNQEDSNSFVPRELSEKAIADLSAYLSIDADQIQVVEAKTVEWPDASLGCPQPDTAYAQVVTPGYWILLEAQGQPYPYHTDQKSQIVLCQGSLSGTSLETPMPVIPVNPDEIKDGQPWVPVD